MNTLGKILKNGRKNINFKLKHVEYYTGISISYLSKLENDKIKKPSIKVLKILSSIYSISLRSLLNFQNIEDMDILTYIEYMNTYKNKKIY